jgi:hypothetical protein
MGSSFIAEKFYDISDEISLYVLLYLYGLSTIFAVIAIEIMRKSQGCHNFALITLLPNILLYSIGEIALLYFEYKKPRYGDFLYGFSLTTENFCHWIITITYIKTSLETRMLLNKETYLKSADEMVFVRNFRCYLATANISASIVIIAISAFFSIADFYESVKLLLIANGAAVVFELLCSFAWAWTLIRLYKDITHSEKLLPNKRIFFIHGSLLTIYFSIWLA